MRIIFCANLYLSITQRIIGKKMRPWAELPKRIFLFFNDEGGGVEILSFNNGPEVILKLVWQFLHTCRHHLVREDVFQGQGEEGWNGPEANSLRNTIECVRFAWGMLGTFCPALVPLAHAFDHLKYVCRRRSAAKWERHSGISGPGSVIWKRAVKDSTTIISSQIALCAFGVYLGSRHGHCAVTNKWYKYNIYL